MKAILTKRLFSGALAVALAAPAALAPTAVYASTPLTDMQNSYAKTEIQALVDAQIISGYGDGSFRPEATMTRSEFATLLAKTLHLQPDAAASQKFTDVDDWARPYVGALVTANLTSGATATTFGANDPISREQLAAFFVRAMGKSEQAQKLNLQTTFEDEYDISDYAKPSVALTQHIGFIKGSESEIGLEFAPQGNADRQAVARLAYEFFAHRDTYTAQIAKIEGVVDLLDRSTAVMNKVTSMQSVVTMTMGKDMNLTMNMDVQLSPMAAHEKGTASGKDENGNLKREDFELYIADDWMYMKTPDRAGWIKTKGANTEFQELIKQNHEQAQYHDYAPYLTIAEQGDTYVLTGNLPSSAAVQSKVTLEIDKATLYQKRYVTELTHGNSVQKMEMTFFNFDKAPAIVVPAEVIAAAVEQ